MSHLLAHTKPNVNPDMVRDSKLRTPLLVACAAGKADVVRVLIRWGADVNNPVGDVIGNKPLDLAVISNNFDTVLALLEAGNINDDKMCTILLPVLYACVCICVCACNTKLDYIIQTILFFFPKLRCTCDTTFFFNIKVDYYEDG